MNKPKYHPLMGFRNCNTWRDKILAYNRYIASTKENPKIFDINNIKQKPSS